MRPRLLFRSYFNVITATLTCDNWTLPTVKVAYQTSSGSQAGKLPVDRFAGALANPGCRVRAWFINSLVVLESVYGQFIFERAGRPLPPPC
jgi:hypothetical protein